MNDFGFALDSWDIDLWNTDLLDTYTFRLVRVRYPPIFFCLLEVLKMSCRHFFRIFTSSKRLQDVFKMSSGLLGRHEFVTLKTCWRRLQDMSWGRFQDLFETNKCLLDNDVRNFFKKNCLSPAHSCYKTSSSVYFSIQYIHIKRIFKILSHCFLLYCGF